MLHRDRNRPRVGFERRHTGRRLRRARGLWRDAHVAEPAAAEAATSPSQTLHPNCTKNEDDDDDGQKGCQCDPHAGDVELYKRVGSAFDFRGVDISLEKRK